jgi:hypothetical protein
MKELSLKSGPISPFYNEQLLSKDFVIHTQLHPLPNLQHRRPLGMTSLRPLESLANRLCDTASSPFEFPIAFSITPSSAKSETDRGGPGTALE